MLELTPEQIILLDQGSLSIEDFLCDQENGEE